MEKEPYSSPTPTLAEKLENLIRGIAISLLLIWVVLLKIQISTLRSDLRAHQSHIISLMVSTASLLEESMEKK